MKLFIVALISIFITQGNLCAQTHNPSSWGSLIHDFNDIPDNMRPKPLWFWNNSQVNPEELREQMKGFKQAGYGGLGILPFGRDFLPKYLTEEYFDVYGVCMDQAEKLGLKLCVYDEYGFPSGTAGDINGDGVGRFKQKYPELTNKRLDKLEYTPTKGLLFETKVTQKYLMAVVAMDMSTKQRVDLSTFVEDSNLSWMVPDGEWKVMVFNCVDAGNSIIDYLDPQAADLFIGMTHDEYYKRFSKYFGNVVEGTFFDEPTMYYADGRTWTPGFNEKFEKKYGFSPALYYPALWYNIGAQTTEARTYLWGFRSELFAEGYIKKVDQWSRDRGVVATGHLDNEEVMNCVGTSGDFMKSFKYLSAPGIDKIGGNRPAERYYKLITSAAYNWDHSLVMSETYGDMGNISWETIYSIAIDQYTKGINMLIPHAVWYSPEKITFRPELSLRNPLYADRLREYNDFLSRLNVLMLNEARWRGDVAILYPIHTMEGDHHFDGPLGHYAGGVEIPYLDYTTVSVNLFDSLGYDHLYIHPEVLDQQCVVKKGKLNLKNKIQHNSFSILVVPSSKTIALSNMEKIRKFANSGGVVIFTTQLPTQATKANDNDKLNAIIEELNKCDNVHYIANPTTQNLQLVMDKYSSKCLVNFTKDPVRNIHKVLNNKNMWLIGNVDNMVKSPEFVINDHIELQIWNPHTGAIDSNPDFVSHKGGKTHINIKMAPQSSLFLVEK